MLDVIFISDGEYGTHVHISTIYGDYNWFDDREDLLVILSEIYDCFHESHSSEDLEKLLNCKVMKYLGVRNE